MGRLHARLAALHAVVRRMDGQPMDAAGAGGDLRPLHFEVLLPLRVVPQRAPLPAEQDLQDRLRMDQRHHLRHGGGVAGAHLHLPDVRHPHLVDGKVAADRRLPLREQGDLRSQMPNTPLSFPFVHHTMPFSQTKNRFPRRSSGPTTGSRDCAGSNATTWWSSISRRATPYCSKTRP